MFCKLGNEMFNQDIFTLLLQLLFLFWFYYRLLPIFVPMFNSIFVLQAFYQLFCLVCNDYKCIKLSIFLNFWNNNQIYNQIYKILKDLCFKSGTVGII